MINRFAFLVALLLAGCSAPRPGASDLNMDEARALLKPGMTTGEFQRHLQTTPQQVSPRVLKWRVADGDLLTEFRKDKQGVWVLSHEVSPDPGVPAPSAKP